MTRTSAPCRGYTMVELLVVLAIMGSLALLGLTLATTNRSPAAVRSLLDQMEGCLSSAQALATATGQDVTLVSQGDWSASGTTPMILAQSASSSDPATVVTAGATDPASFKLMLSSNGKALAREHAYAGIVTNAAGSWWTTAQGGNDVLTSQVPFSTSGSVFNGILGKGANNLFQGGAASTASALQVSGSNKRFQSIKFIEVVGLSGGGPYAGAPMGLLVVLPNGGNVFKFYNPGIVNGNGHWRRM